MPAVQSDISARRVARDMPPTPARGNGNICYLEIPSRDPTKSATFYRDVLGWSIRARSDGHIAFDDGVGEVSGTWVTGRDAPTDVGTLVYIMVDDIEATLRKIAAHGGRIVQPVRADAPEITARFQDPDGNLFGLYQEPARGG